MFIWASPGDRRVGGLVIAQGSECRRATALVANGGVQRETRSRRRSAGVTVGLSTTKSGAEAISVLASATFDGDPVPAEFMAETR